MHKWLRERQRRCRLSENGCVPQNICFVCSIPPSFALWKENQQFVANEISQCDPCKHLEAGKQSCGAEQNFVSLSISKVGQYLQPTVTQRWCSLFLFQNFNIWVQLLRDGYGIFLHLPQTCSRYDAFVVKQINNNTWTVSKNQKWGTYWC